MRPLLFLAPVLLCGFTTTHPSGSATSMKWAPATLTLSIDEGGVAAITDGSDIQAVRNAFAAWNAVACSTFRFVDGGLSTTASTFTVKFVHSMSAWSGLGADTDAVAVTKLTPSGGTWSSVTLYVSDFGQVEWGTDGNLGAHDLQSTITHELGHALGLLHTSDPRATMYFAGRNGVSFERTLSDDDIAGVCFLYPVASAGCSSDLDCPLVYAPDGTVPDKLVYVCSSGTCVTGKRSYGEDCFTNTSCTGNACVRYDGAKSFDPGVCTNVCPCAGGDVCSSGYCAARSAYCDSTCTGANRHCSQTVDGDFACVIGCDDAAYCAEAGADGICFDATADYAGVCRVPGPKANDVTCTEPSQCASLICTVNANGESVCTGTELATPTELPPPVDPTEPANPTQPTNPTPPADPTPDEDPTPTNISGGCTAVPPTQIGTIVALIFVFTRVKWRKRLSGVTVACSSHDQVKRHIVR